METVRLGRTGFEVSVAGLGCGGHSRLGIATGGTEDEAIRVVHRALDLGITLIDTARAYGTEEVVGRALAGRRDEVTLCTKVLPTGRGGEPLTAAQLHDSVEKSLRRLATDRIDVMFLHGVGVDHLAHVRAELVPELLALRDDGKVRAVGATEAFATDPGHAALQQLLRDDEWLEVVMVGFNPLNPSARERVLAETIRQDIGVLVMFAVRRALSQPAALRELLADLVASGEIDADADALDLDDALGFLVHDGGAASVVDAAYRFSRHEPGCDVVLTGTGSVDHLEANVASITSPPLPDPDLARLQTLFGHLDSVSAN
jgi:aryl-alcohol dehydrogenase-like predicted oxidoreductase